MTTTDIADELWRTRKVRVDRKKIETDALKRIGRYAIPIQVFEGVTVEVKTLVVPEGGELPPDEELAAMEAAEAARIAEELAAAQAAIRSGARAATAAAEVEYLEDAAPEQTPAEAAEAAERASRSGARAGCRGRLGSRFRRPQHPPALSRRYSTGLWSIAGNFPLLPGQTDMSPVDSPGGEPGPPSGPMGRIEGTCVPFSYQKHPSPRRRAVDQHPLTARRR